MKVLIENLPDLTKVSSKKQEATEWIFYQILNVIVKSRDKNSLIENVSEAMVGFSSKNYRGTDLFSTYIDNSEFYMETKKNKTRILTVNLNK